MSSIILATLDNLVYRMGRHGKPTRRVSNDRSGAARFMARPGNSPFARRQRKGWLPAVTGRTEVRRSWLLPFLLLAVLLWVGTRPDALADGSANISPTVMLQYDAKFFAYAESGEKVRYSFTRGVEASSTNPSTARIIIYSPTGQVSSFNANAVGNTYTGTFTANASTAGIWTVFVDFSSNYGSALFTPYDIDVLTSANAPINGRVYTEFLPVRQNGTDPPANPNLFMISEFGYKYSVGLRGYNGIGSFIQTTRYGLRRNGTCVSLYESKDSGPYSSGEECGGLYKQFFTTIDATMPASAPRYNITTGQTVTEWLHPPVAPDPTITGLTFTPSSIGNPASGQFTATIANYAGNARFQIDVNNNGVYTDAIDRTIPFNVQLGQNTIIWDGVNGQGGIVGCSTNLRARILVDKVGEIHFTFYDVETLEDGIRVTRTNGVGAPNSTLYWDDTKLGERNTRTTTVYNGIAGVNSTATAGVGVHGWLASGPQAVRTEPWGNERFIENWTFLPNMSVQQEIPLTVPCDFGDAPNSYATVIGSNGPSHKPTSTLYIGAVAADGESDGIPTGTAADGDDTNGTDDEDGLTSAPPVLVECTDVYSLTVSVYNTTGQTAYLRGWVDFNRNGIFDNNEFTTANLPYDSTSTSTVATLTWGNLGSLGLTTGQSYIRLRVSTTNFVSPTGTLNDGEVEDYPVTIVPAISFSAVATDATSCSVADGSITIMATGSTGSYEYSLNGIDYTPFASPYTIPDLSRGGYRLFVRDQNFTSCAGDTLLAINAPGCCDFYDNQTITGTVFNPGAGITVQYLLTNASGQILSVQSTPSFPPQTLGDYYIYTLAYTTASPAPTGVTVGQNVNGIAGCCYQLYPPDPISVCGCPTVTLIDASYSVCAGQNLSVLQVNTTAVAPSQVEFVYFTTPQAAAAAVYGTPTGVLGAASPTSAVAALTDVAFLTTPGTYYVYARITPTPTDPACRPFVEIPVSVSACTDPCSLTVTAAASQTAICVGGSVTLSADVTPTGSYTYTWSGPNGYVGTGANPMVSATAAITNSGTYTVVVTDAGGCSATATVAVSITVCCDLVVGVNPTSVTSCVSTNTGALTVSYTGTGSYQYSLNGGALQTLGVSPTVLSTLSAGSYTLVVQEVGNPTCSQTISTTIANPDTPPVFALSNSPLCTSSTLSLSATGNYTGYHWSGPNGFTSNQQNPSIPNATTLASGVYSVSIVDAGGCTASASTTVTIASQPSLSITAGSGLTICSGQSTTLNVGGSNGAPVTWTNNLGQSGTGTTINFPGVTNLSGQPLTVTYVISAAAGPCSDGETVDLIINPAPILQVVPQNAIICALEQTQIVATATPATATINWTRIPAIPAPDNGSGTGSVTVNQSLPAGNYTYSFTATAGGCTSSPVVSQLTVNN